MFGVLWMLWVFWMWHNLSLSVLKVLYKAIQAFYGPFYPVSNSAEAGMRNP